MAVVPFASRQSIPHLLQVQGVKDHRIDAMITLKGGRPEFHPTRGFVFHKHLISLGEEGEIVVEKYNYHTEITCVPTAGIPKLFRLIVENLRDAGLDVSSFVYTKETDLVRVEV